MTATVKTECHFRLTATVKKMNPVCSGTSWLGINAPASSAFCGGCLLSRAPTARAPMGAVCWRRREHWAVRGLGVCSGLTFLYRSNSLPSHSVLHPACQTGPRVCAKRLIWAGLRCGVWGCPVLPDWLSAWSCLSDCKTTTWSCENWKHRTAFASLLHS